MSTPIVNAEVIRQYQDRFGQVPGSQEPCRESQQWAQICQELLEEVTRLRQEKAELQEQFTLYERAVYSLMRPKPEDLNFTKEEIFANLGKGPSLREIIAELEQEQEG